MKRCPNCNNLISEELKECNICGYLFVDEKENIDHITMNNKSEENKTELIPENNNIEIENLYNSSSQKDNRTEKNNISKLIIAFLCFSTIVSLIYAINETTKYNNMSDQYKETITELNKNRNENSSLKRKNNTLEEKIVKLESENNELVNGASKQLTDIKNAYEKNEWQNVIDLTATLHEQYNDSEEDIEAQNLAKISQENIDKENAAKEAEKAKGYETGITYDQLARTPEQFENKKVKFYGKVIQVSENDSSVNIRLAVNDNYDTVILGEYLKSTVSSRILEDDYITIYGTSVGTISYESTFGKNITIPGVYIEKIDQ